MAKRIAIFNEAYENEPSEPDKQLPQSATHGFPAPSKKGDDGVSGTKMASGCSLVDRTDRSDFPDVTELDSLGFED